MRTTRTLPRILTPGEVDALLAALRMQRDRAMVLAMVLGGLRRCEVLGLRLEDLHVGQRPVFIGEGKGGWGRTRSHKDDLLMSIFNRSSTADTENDAQHQVVPPRVRRPRKGRVRFDGDVWSG